MYSAITIRLTSLFLTVGVIAVATFAAPAHAAFRYEYTSNFFNVTTFQQTVLDPNAPPGGITFGTSERITAVVYSAALLTNGAGVSDIMSFDLTDAHNNHLIYPANVPMDPNAPSGSGSNPNYQPVCSVATVDAFGLPTVWDISINYEVSAVRTTFTNFIRTSNALDTTAGGIEQPGTIFSFSGTLAGNPGVWTVSAVPEPEASALLFVGLGLVGYFARRRG